MKDGIRPINDEERRIVDFLSKKYLYGRFANIDKAWHTYIDELHELGIFPSSDGYKKHICFSEEL